MIRNMDYNYATILLITILYIFFTIQYDMTTKRSKYFRHLLGSVGVTALMNIIADYTALHFGNIPDIIISGLFSVYIFVAVLSPYALLVYTRVLVSPDKKKPYDYFNEFLMGVHCLFCIAVFKHPVFYIVGEQSIEYGRFYPEIYILSGYYLLVVLFRMILNIRKLTRRQTYGVSAFVVTSFIGAGFQWFLFEGNIVIYFIYAVASIILFFTFETPDYQKLMETTEELQKSKEELEDLTKKGEELTRTVHELMSSSSWVIYFNEDKSIKNAQWSSQFKTMLGYDDEDVVDLQSLWVESLHPEEEQFAVKSFLEGMEDKEYRIEIRLRQKDGSYKWYLCTGETKRDENGTLLSYQGVVMDIEDEKCRERLTEEKLKALEELEKSQQELKEALFEAQEASKAKTIFLSNMSHDIRTPMNAIVGYTQLAQNNIDNQQEIRECLSIIKSSGEHLLSLINDVLDMSRIESGKVKIEVEACNLEIVMAELFNLSRAKIAEKGQTYEAEYGNLSNKYVMCDRLRLNQILINCVSNAVKYTPEGGRIRVILEQDNYDREGFAAYVFRIKDTGIGMTKEFLEKVFDPFERASNSTSSQIQGTGLGMAITKNLVDMMGGTIKAESELGKGSEFIIRIPLKVISDDEYLKEVEPGNNIADMDEMLDKLSGKHFLVVDDNKLNRGIVRKLLEQRGMTIEEATSGQEAIDRLSNVKDGEINIVFMDIQMPQMTGYEATDIIMKLDNPAIKNIPIIAMTANAFEEDKRMAREHGMIGHVTKPFKINELIETLYSILIDK